MKNLIFPSLLTLVLVGPGLSGCSDEDAKPAVTLGDAAVGDPDTGTGPVGSSSCTTYCSNVVANCTGENIQYKDNADCMAYCNSAKWPAGVPDEMSGNTLACRIYHSGVAKGDPVTHCPHGGPTGAGVCGKITTRSDAVTAYTRVDRMGMPAVATALVGDGARKTAYNDGNPANDVKDFLADWGMRLQTFHTALDDDLMALKLTPCSMMPAMAGGTLPACLTQEYAPGKTVASLIAPSDVIRINPATAAGFPNGRKLEDPVIDVTLAVLLLDLTKHPADTLAKVPLNPAKNDVAGGTFLTTFPYLHPAQTP
jgi:hypothetical protein